MPTPSSPIAVANALAVNVPQISEVIIDGTAATSSFDLSALLQGGAMTQIQSMYVDNSVNAGTVTFVFSAPLSQRIQIQGNSQGWYPVFVSQQLGGAVTVTTASGTASVPVFFANFYMPAQVWGVHGTTITGFTFNGLGYGLVADPLVDATIVATTSPAATRLTTLDYTLATIVTGGTIPVSGTITAISGTVAVSNAGLTALNTTIAGGQLSVNIAASSATVPVSNAGLTALATTISGSKVAISSTTLDGEGTLTSRSTSTVAATSTQLMASNASRNYILIKSPEAADLWINLKGGTAGINAADCIKLPSGGSIYEASLKSSYLSTSAITYYCATGSLQLNALEA